MRRFTRGGSALVVLWALACAIGMLMMWRYKTRPGDPGDPPARWPAHATLVRPTGQMTLVMVAHPRCVCTKASLAELDHIMRAAPPGVAAHVLFDIPAGLPAGWERGALWDQAAAIPGVELVADPGGVEAARFGVEVSGHVLVFDGDGDRVFSGGITGARGHTGDNLGRARVAALLAGGVAARDRSHVYGCSLDEPESREARR